MKVEELIEVCETQGLEWVADEMRYYDDNPEAFKEGHMVPNFENLDEDVSLPILHFYIGVAFGTGMERKH